jgi:deoxyadenosine/deoxycytidine kinase
MGELKYIIVDGLVKTGKTRLARIIAKELSGRLILDNRENPFTDGFYTALARGENSNFLKTQLIFLLNRYSQQLEIKQKGLFHKTTVTDYIFFRDGIYAHTILNDEDLAVYKKMFNLFAQNVFPADLVIYLQVSFTEMLRRIQESGTELEKKVPNEYWREIFEAYNYYFFNFKSSPLLVVNMEKINLDRQTDVQNLLREIENHKKGTIYYAPA